MAETVTWFVYILRCADGTYYTGITTDLNRRVAQHNGARCGARYTRARRPVELIYSEICPHRSAAAKREYAIKRLSQQKKLKLVGAGQ